MGGRPSRGLMIVEAELGGGHQETGKKNKNPHKPNEEKNRTEKTTRDKQIPTPKKRPQRGGWEG